MEKGREEDGELKKKECLLGSLPPEEGKESSNFTFLFVQTFLKKGNFTYWRIDIKFWLGN